MHRFRLAQSRRNRRRVFQIGKHDGPEGRIDGGVTPHRGRFRRWRVFDPSQESLHRGGIYFNDFVGHVSMGFVVGFLDRRFVRRLRKAERGASLFIKPVGDEENAVLVLDLQVFFMRISNGMAGSAFHIMTIHIDRHRVGLLSSWALCRQR